MVTTRNGLNFSPNYKGSNLKSDLVSHDKRQSKLSDKIKNYGKNLAVTSTNVNKTLRSVHFGVVVVELINAEE